MKNRICAQLLFRSKIGFQLSSVTPHPNLAASYSAKADKRAKRKPSLSSTNPSDDENKPGFLSISFLLNYFTYLYDLTIHLLLLLFSYFYDYIII